ncbi:hypothetical protein Tco_0492228 [Tanacetum coccineum]
MTTSVEKQNHAKFCEFHSEVGHNTGECIHLRKQIEEMLKVGKLSHLIKELKQNNGKEQPKVTKKGETSEKDKALAILMVQPWERVARQRITQSFSPKPEIFFPLLGEDKGTEGPMIIEAEIEGHCIYRISPSPYNVIFGRPGVRKVARSSVNSSQNAKDTSGRGNNHLKKQQVGSAGMCDGLRT